MKKLLTLIAVIIFCNTNLKAQDDPNVGFYADGVKVTELNCYHFKRLTLVLPYNNSYSQFDRMALQTTVGKVLSNYTILGNLSVKSTAAFLSNFVKGKYLIYDIFRDGFEATNNPAEYEQRENNASPELKVTTQHLDKSFLAFYIGKEQPVESEITISLFGQTISGYKEELYNDVLTKKPQYKTEKLTEVTLKLTSRTERPRKASDKSIVELPPCTYPGTKVDFNSLGGKSSSGNSNTKTPTDKKATKEKDEDDKDEKDE